MGRTKRAGRDLQILTIEQLARQCPSLMSIMLVREFGQDAKKVEVRRPVRNERNKRTGCGRYLIFTDGIRCRVFGAAGLGKIGSLL